MTITMILTLTDRTRFHFPKIEGYRDGFLAAKKRLTLMVKSRVDIVMLTTMAMKLLFSTQLARKQGLLSIITMTLKLKFKRQQNLLLQR